MRGGQCKHQTVEDFPPEAISQIAFVTRELSKVIVGVLRYHLVPLKPKVDDAYKSVADSFPLSRIVLIIPRLLPI